MRVPRIATESGLASHNLRGHPNLSGVQPALHSLRLGRKQPYDRDAGAKPPALRITMDTARRGNYESGSDYVLEYGELRFTFNERDFTERVEQAASKLGFVDGPLGDDEREDLVNLAVNGEVTEPHSDLGEHINECWATSTAPPSAPWCTGSGDSCFAAPGSTSV